MAPYGRDGELNWKRLEAMARRWGRLASQADARLLGNVGGNFRIGRMLASGDLRLVALYLIDQQPRHGYDLMKAVEERSGGFYAPSPGVVYPALTFLEEAGYVTSAADGNKKLYTITDAGRAHLADNREAIEGTLAFLVKAGEQMHRFRDFARSDWPFGRDQREGFDEASAPGRPFGGEQDATATATPDTDMKGVVPELNEARKGLKAAIKAARHFSPERQKEAAAVLRQAAADLAALGESSAEDDIDI
ncbi:MAG: PadR family transcriptional regulator [Devosia sp.]|jgi:DNA-binding PadR family transcriptional regulator|nr:PadR family transcriptional regulator [Devosia sp.]